jgi:hypothetical protein
MNSVLPPKPKLRGRWTTGIPSRDLAPPTNHLIPEDRILSQERGEINSGHQTLELSFQMMDRENFCVGSGNVSRLI